MGEARNHRTRGSGSDRRNPSVGLFKSATLLLVSVFSQTILLKPVPGFHIHVFIGYVLGREKPSQGAGRECVRPFWTSAAETRADDYVLALQVHPKNNTFSPNN